MDGDTHLERALNVYLTSRFIASREIPSDECLTEARDIIKLFEIVISRAFTDGVKWSSKHTMYIHKPLEIHKAVAEYLLKPNVDKKD